MTLSDKHIGAHFLELLCPLRITPLEALRKKKYDTKKNQPSRGVYMRVLNECVDYISIYVCKVALGGSGSPVSKLENLVLRYIF